MHKQKLRFVGGHLNFISAQLLLLDEFSHLRVQTEFYHGPIRSPRTYQFGIETVLGFKRVRFELVMSGWLNPENTFGDRTASWHFMIEQELRNDFLRLLVA